MKTICTAVRRNSFEIELLTIFVCVLPLTKSCWQFAVHERWTSSFLCDVIKALVILVKFLFEPLSLQFTAVHNRRRDNFSLWYSDATEDIKARALKCAFSKPSQVYLLIYWEMSAMELMFIWKKRHGGDGKHNMIRSNETTKDYNKTQTLWS